MSGMPEEQKWDSQEYHQFINERVEMNLKKNALKRLVILLVSCDRKSNT